ncbi:MAG TPA: hypothetical protein VE954_17015 [Oligoflexus sp.]|uniref:hypothetical protein n=1 Tax=Oligoflexus sp. TaxID=1971216 RepID=UPI002D226589|nr:hypothetical protein [Oligoflexus sp.]HYX34800.1 hypothetical protein [Oligoflexus sp.]
MRSSSHRESGFSTMGLVIILAGVAGVVGGYNMLRSQSVLKASDVRNAGQEAGDMNFNAFNVYQALAAGTTPAIFPDPYLPVNNARMVVSSKATPNNLWKGATDTITIFSTSYHGNPQGTKTATEIKSVQLEKKNPARPYLITHADVKAKTTVGMALTKSNKDINSTATVNLPPPPTPDCMIGFTGTPSTQPFTCLKKAAVKQPASDPKTGLPVLDPKTGEPVVIETPAVFGSCSGAALAWSFDTDVGQTVTAHFFGNGVIVDANIQQMAGSTQPLSFAGGPIPKNSQAIPYPGANRVEAKNAKLRDVTFVATSSSWMELNVMGPDGTVGKCTAGLHVNMGPALNTEADSWGSETLVQLADGSHKKISQLQFGDRVWNPQFKEAASIVHIHETAPTSSMVALDLGSSVVHVTSHHPFLSQRGLVLAQDLRAGDQLPAADASWKTVVGNRAYRPAEGYKVYDVFLNSPRSARDRLMNVEGLLVPSYEWQSQLATLPSSTLFDMPQLPNLW